MTTGSGFWTTRPPRGFEDLGSATLCEKHAVDAMNTVFRIWGESPVTTASEGMAIYAAIYAAVGLDFDLVTYSETGRCEAESCSESNERGS